jgi:hypothetical protein
VTVLNSVRKTSTTLDPQVSSALATVNEAVAAGTGNTTPLSTPSPTPTTEPSPTAAPEASATTEPTP